MSDKHTRSSGLVIPSKDAGEFKRQLAEARRLRGSGSGRSELDADFIDDWDHGVKRLEEADSVVRTLTEGPKPLIPGKEKKGIGFKGERNR